MSTRKRLKEKGVLLEGVVAPKWFKRRCDGCSVPTWSAKRLFSAKMLRAACDIHDTEYFLISMLYPEGDAGRARLRRESDKRLKRNVRVIACNFGKWRFRGLFLAPIYYAGVRLGGSHAMKNPEEKRDRWPLTRWELETLDECFHDYLSYENTMETQRFMQYYLRMEKGLVDAV